MAKLIDITGNKYDKLLVLEKALSRNRHTYWKCQCDCGNICEVSGEYLKKQGLPRSCGCHLKKNIKAKQQEEKKNYLVGQRFGRLIVLENTGESNNQGMLWKCKCDCGNEKIIPTQALTSKHTQSCGCLQKEKLFEANVKHGKSHTRLHSIWKTMKQRCLNPNNYKYKDYGGRGITICDEWQNDYLKFEVWALENGYDENAKYGECTIDRIDVNGNYEPSNCRWVSGKEQARNKRNCRYVFFEGEKYTLAELSELLGVPAKKVYRVMSKVRRKNNERKSV